jgi:hypothetical protein
MAGRRSSSGYADHGILAASPAGRIFALVRHSYPGNIAPFAPTLSRFVSADGKLKIELAGDLAGILALTSNNPRRNGRGLQVTLVAGARNHLYRTTVTALSRR